MPGKKREDANPVLAGNKKAFHDYQVTDRLEAGIQLAGTEVKSCRERSIQLREGFITVDHGEAWLRNVHISPYSFGNRYNQPELRPRRLLLHKKEITRLQSHLSARGATAVPLSFYLKDGLIKVEIGFCVGKHEYDRRDSLRKNDAEREMKRVMANFNKKNQ